jgi:cyclopropane fatty-acyl-phospholipid synthase-like methyltransferase
MIKQVKEKLLSFPAVYGALQWLLANPKVDVMSDYLRIEDGCKILDIGCGPARVIERLPDAVEYLGFDISEKYIEDANQKYGGPLRSFRVQGVDEADLGENKEYFDLVMAWGVLHHLKDEQAAKLFKLAEAALKKGGIFFSVDTVFLHKQHLIARCLALMDRGEHVRTPEKYKTLAEDCFDGPVEQHVRCDTLRLPYNVLIMKVVK